MEVSGTDDIRDESQRRCAWPSDGYDYYTVNSKAGCIVGTDSVDDLPPGPLMPGTVYDIINQSIPLLIPTKKECRLRLPK